MDSTDNFMTRDQFLIFADSELEIDLENDTSTDSAVSLGTSRSSSTLPSSDTVIPSIEETSSSSSSGEARTLAAKPAPPPAPSTQFVNVRRLASGYEPYPAEIPLRYGGAGANMRLGSRTRKGHRKSRQGCYNCKKRKIKCQESLPACDNCVRKDLECTYPVVKTPSLLRDCARPESPGPLMSVQLQTTPIFSMADMRLFHHFLSVAYPHLPVGNENVWVGRVPAIAHHYEFLMHAMLGLAASHLSVTTRADYTGIALQHRVKAIQGFNEALSKPTRSGSDGDALLAAVYAMTFQSSYLSDGLRDFLTMIRGCALVSGEMVANDVPISFSITLEEHHEYMSSRLHDLPKIAEEFVKGAQDSLAAVSPLLMQDENNQTAYKALVECMDAAEAGGPMAYYKFIAIHNALYSMGHQAFQDFIDMKNEVGLVLLGHFVAIELIMSPIYSREWKGRVLSVPMNGIIDWIAKIQDEISPSMQVYLDWPNSMVALVRREMKEKLMAPWLREVIVRQ